MSRFRKGIFDTVMLVVVIVVFLMALMFLFYLSRYGIVKIKGDVNVYLDVQDKGSKIISFVKCERGGMNYMEIIGSFDGMPEDIRKQIFTTLRHIGASGLIVRDLSSGKSMVYGKGTSKATISLPDNFKIGWPVETHKISSGYGWRIINRKPDFHGGVDFAVEIGTNVHAVYDGTVASVGRGCEASPSGGCHISCKETKDKYCCCNGGLGNFVVIKHRVNGETFYTHYDHLNEVRVDVGDEVRKGDVIGKTGNTGYSTGPHLHFEINKQMTKHDETSVDPCPYFPEFPENCEQGSQSISENEASFYIDIPLPGGRRGKMGLIE